MRTFIILTMLAGMIVLGCVCQGGESSETQKESYEAEKTAMEEHHDNSIKISSSAFIHEGMIPIRYTCDGNNVSPELSWRCFPKETESMALICEDPDAPGGTFIHWVVYNIPPHDSTLAYCLDADSNRCLEGLTDFGIKGYGGPCPPSGTHRYYFRLYALDKMLELEEDASASDLREAMKDNVLAEGEIMGRYERH